MDMSIMAVTVALFVIVTNVAALPAPAPAPAPVPVPVENFCIGHRSVIPADISSYNESDPSSYYESKPRGDGIGNGGIQAFIPCDVICCPSVDSRLDHGHNRCSCAQGFMGWKRDSQPTTEKVLLNRFLPQPLTFPSGMNLGDYNAIQSSLVLLQETLLSQDDLHETCMGKRDYDYEVYGYSQNIFRRLCTPEIRMPVPSAELDGARRKIVASTWIDIKLATQGLSSKAVCSGVTNARLPTDGLDTEFIASQVCE